MKNLTSQVATVKLKIVVNPDNTSRPIVVSGRCHPHDGQRKLSHVIEHCIIDPKLSLPISEEFVSLYCTSYSTLRDHFYQLKQLHQYDIRLVIFYSVIKLDDQ